jgi:hypothetical protein
MGRRKKKQAQPSEPITKTPPPVLDLTTLEGQLRHRGVATNGPGVQIRVVYYSIYINGTLAHSPWMSVNDDDVIEVYEENDSKVEWKVGDEEINYLSNCPKPHVDSLFGRGGIPSGSI